MKKKVMVAMSGGVDSSVAAALLLEQGYEVCGVTLKLSANEEIGLTQPARTCCSLADVEDARRVAYRLGIEHFVFNFSQQFRQEVIQRFAEAYATGRTPNPCIDCNRYLKFGCLLERATALGMDFIATGHYARKAVDPLSGRLLLQTARDRSKDQTYVLYALTQEQLERTLFPLGDLTKNQVRALAEQRGLRNAWKPDSQDICFVPDGDYAAFLTKALQLPDIPGDFIDGAGQVLGRHRGVIHYTVGQRRGLGLALGRPQYVTSIDADSNRVALGDEQDLYCDCLTARDVNWLSAADLTAPREAAVKTRYSRDMAAATLYPLADGEVLVRFREPQRSLTPGQAAVFYDGDLVLGGGVIS